MAARNNADLFKFREIGFMVFRERIDVSAQREGFKAVSDMLTQVHNARAIESNWGRFLLT